MLATVNASIHNLISNTTSILDKNRNKIILYDKNEKTIEKKQHFWQKSIFFNFFAENRKKYLFGQKIEKLSFRQKSKTKLTNLTKIEKINLLTKMEIIWQKSNLFNLLDKNRKKLTFIWQKSKKTNSTKIDFFLTFLTKI